MENPTVSLFDLIAPYNGGQKRTSRQIMRGGVPITRFNTLPLRQYCDALARCEKSDDYNIAHTLAKYLRSNGDLCKTRILSKEVSRILAEAGELGKLFEKVFISPRYADDMCEQERDRLSLAHISPECRELVANFPQPSFGTMSARSPPGVVFRGLRSRGDDNDWPFILERCRYIRTLTITTGSADAENPTDKISAAIELLRTAIGESSLRVLDTLRLVPVDAMYFRALKWTGPAAGPSYGLPGLSRGMVWNNISRLEIQILPCQHRDTEDLLHVQEAKVFHAFLSCIAPKLKSLKFSYLKREGTHPFKLLSELDLRAAGQDDIHWPELTELWLGRVKNAEDAKFLYKELAPKLERCWELAWSETGGELEFRYEARGEAWKIRRLGDGSNGLGATWDSVPLRSARPLSQTTIWPGVVPSSPTQPPGTSAPSAPTTSAAPRTRPKTQSSVSSKAASALSFLRRPTMPAIPPLGRTQSTPAGEEQQRPAGNLLSRVFRPNKGVRRGSSPPPKAGTETTEGTELQVLPPPTTSPKGSGETARAPELRPLVASDAPSELRQMAAFEQQSWFRAGSGARLPDEVVRRNEQQVEAVLTRSRLRRESESVRPTIQELLRGGSTDGEQARSSVVTLWPTAEDLAAAPSNPAGAVHLLVAPDNQRPGSGSATGGPAAGVERVGGYFGREEGEAGDRASQVTVWPAFPVRAPPVRSHQATLARLDLPPQSPFMGARSHWGRLQRRSRPEEEGPGQEQGRENGEGSARGRDWI